MENYDVTQALFDFECGLMETEEELIELFQHLVNTGLAWQLQGSHGRMAQRLINEGHINSPALG